MMKKKINNGIFYVVISLVAVLAIGSVAAIAFVGNANRVIENVEVYQEAPQPATPVEDGTLGAVSGPDLYSDYWNTNNVVEWNQSMANNLATSTVCALKSPAATSTLVFGSIIAGTATGTAQYLEIARAATAYATTTSLGKITVAASALYSLIASSTITDSLVFPPSNYLVVKNGMSGTQTGNGYSDANSASCKARWIQN